MSKFPVDFDNDVSLPPVNDNIDEIGGEAINSLRDAVFNIEEELGLTSSGTTGSLSSRLDVALNPDGTVKSSALTSLGLVTLPITDGQISNAAQILESKLKLDHKTQDLFNYIQALSGSVNEAIGWISITGLKLQPHIIGAAFKHTLTHINVDDNPARYLKNKFNLLRNNSESYSLIDDMNDELVLHQQLDGSPSFTPQNVPTLNGGSYPSTYAHTSSGIYLNSSNFSVIPQDIQDVQEFAEFIDGSGTFLYGSRIQNLYSNGIPRVSRSSSLLIDGYGTQIVEEIDAITYLRGNIGNDSAPVDDINNGDDIIELKPKSPLSDNNFFDTQFALIKIGDIIRVNYGNVETSFLVKEKKYLQSGPDKKFIVRIAGKNLAFNEKAKVRIDRALYNSNKFGVLAVAAANNNFSGLPSLIVGSARAAQCLGIGFNANHIDNKHYNLYLAIYPTGNPKDGYTILPSIDITGNAGKSPGKYTLDTIVENVNNAFRKSGFNYRFIAYSNNGEFGIMLADSYGNVGFSILSGILDSDGSYNVSASAIAFQNNVIGVASTGETRVLDALGFGPFGANIASPPYTTSFAAAEQAQIPTKIFYALKRNNFYVNGAEREKLDLDVGQAIDTFGDGYWTAEVFAEQVYPGVNGRVEKTYRIYQDLSTAKLKIGKTIVVQPLNSGNLIDSGRFIIKDMLIACDIVEPYTDITVYDSVHGNGFSPVSGLIAPATTSLVRIYFNSDSVSFNNETATDFDEIVTPFKRHFEVFVNERCFTFTHERARVNIHSANITVNGSATLYTHTDLQKLNIIRVSPKLRGYQFGSVNKITLHINSYNETTGAYSGYLCKFDGFGITSAGKLVSGKKGQVTRFYDETNIDFIDVKFDVNQSVSSFTDQNLDFQLFPTLSLDDEIMLLSTCQLNDSDNKITYLRDERQFGNISEKEFSTSALNFLSAPERHLHGNGVIRGFDISDYSVDVTNKVYLNGGLALVNGKLIQMNDEAVVIPLVEELIGAIHFKINWAVCVSDKGEYQTIALTDYDSFYGTPVSGNRVMTVLNVVDLTIYNIDSISFSDLINTRKDLTLLYIVQSEVVTPMIGDPYAILNKKDARRYVNDVDNNIDLKLTSGDSQGNFKNMTSIFNWIMFNNSFNGNVNVKSASASNTGIVNNPVLLNFDNLVTIDGENRSSIVSNNKFTIGSNLTLKNLNITFNGGLSFSGNIKNLKFENCVITIRANSSFPADFSTTNTLATINAGSKITFEDCTINANYVDAAPGGSIFVLNNTSDFSFIRSKLIASFVTDDQYPGDCFTITSSKNFRVIDSKIEGNFKRAINNITSDDMIVSGSSFSSIYNPSVNSPVDLDYDVNAFSNVTHSVIYSDVSSKLNNIKIDNCKFTYSGFTGSGHRYNFISFNLTQNTSVLNGLTISNCKFDSDISIDVLLAEDQRGAIAIVNSATSRLPGDPQPVAVNILIDNNYCGRDQSIIVSSFVTTIEQDFEGVTYPVGSMVYPGLCAENVTIQNNTCGTIGYWISSGSRYLLTDIQRNDPETFMPKVNGLKIKGNNCHLIASMDAKGKPFIVVFEEPAV